MNGGIFLLAYGTRPEYLKLKPLITEFKRVGVNYKLLFTGQHENIGRFEYDYIININESGINRLDLIVKSIMDKLSYVLNINKINAIIVQGDTTSAMAVALSAFHNRIKVIHLEAGLRTYDKNNPYPEEVNRKIITQIADINLCPTELSKENLEYESVDLKSIYVVGNTVIDNLLSYVDKCSYDNKVLVTLHRRENHENLDKWFTTINNIAEKYKEFEFIIPLHPNPNVQKHKGLLTNLTVINPLNYDDLLNLLIKTRLVITDSGGLQEECSFFNKKCLVCRVETERPEALEQSSFLVKSPEVLSDMFDEHIKSYEINYICPFGDGHASEKITQILINENW